MFLSFYFLQILLFIQNNIQFSQDLKFGMAFETGKRGQIAELHSALNSKSFEDKKHALKKVIAQMTLGKDLSQLFQDVIKCLQYQDLDIKKLVYLYTINYSRTRPDDAIMSINLFTKDAVNKSNPVIRALAVRTMSSLRVPKLNEYLVGPLKRALDDEDPYVRKTAVLSVPKVYEIAPQDEQTNNLVTQLENLVMKQPNALVLANGIASLQEIGMITGRSHIKVDEAFLNRVLVAVNECMEWAQVFILDFLCKYTPKDEGQAQMIIDRIIPRLSHINPAVVFGAIKILVRYLDYLSNQDLIKNLCKKLTPSIISVVTYTPQQIQYAILKNLNYIIQKRPSVLQGQISCFFCKFSQPYYIKNQKIQILTRIINLKNYESVLDQLKEYIGEVDQEFVTKCIRALGKIAIRYEKSIEKCLGIVAKKLSELRGVAEHAEQVANEMLITCQNILRKYPSKYNYDGMFADLIYLLDYPTEAEAKEASIWILGEYAEQIYTVALNTFKKWINNFENEERIVQLQILTSAVKVFIKYPDEFETLISDLLTIATQKVDNPDVRDRAFIYWRMLSTDPSKTKNVVFGYRPQAKDTDKLVDRKFLNEMMKNLGYASSLFEKKPQQLFQKSLAQTKGIQIQSQQPQQTQSVPVKQVTKSPTKNVNNTNNQDIFMMQAPVEKKPQEKKPTENVDLLDLI